MITQINIFYASKLKKKQIYMNCRLSKLGYTQFVAKDCILNMTDLFLCLPKQCS